MARISMTVNGKVRTGNVDPRLLLVHFLREQLRLTGTHIGCDTTQCGACTVLVDGRSAKSCTMFAVQADGSTITTIEGLAPDGELHPLQEGFWEEHGLQCGYCTPGMIMAAVDAAEGQPDAVGTGDPRRDLRQFLPLHRLPAHRQRHSTRREEGLSHGHDSCSAEARRRAHQAPRGSASHSGPRHLRRRHHARRHAAPGVQAQRRRARPHPLDRHQRREGDGRRRSRLHRRARSPSSWRRCRSARRSRRRTIARSPWTRSATAASRSPSSSRAIATSPAMPPTPSSCRTTRCRPSSISSWR